MNIIVNKIITAIACLNTERNFIGFELNEEYYNMSLKRISENE
jgi:site-specific DNA-methyltransferase (adenine-specific)